MRGIRTLDSNQRYTTLKERLLDQLHHTDHKDKADTAEKEITPYDFM